MTTKSPRTDYGFDIDAAEAALHEHAVEHIMLAASANRNTTCKCPKCDSWIPCNRHIPDFCHCPNCGMTH